MDHMVSPVAGRRAQYAVWPAAETPSAPRVAQSAPINTTGIVGVGGGAAAVVGRCRSTKGSAIGAAAQASTTRAAAATAHGSQRRRVCGFVVTRGALGAGSVAPSA